MLSKYRLRTKTTSYGSLSSANSVKDRISENNTTISRSCPASKGDREWASRVVAFGGSKGDTAISMVGRA